jgi:hypothetical protein
MKKLSPFWRDFCYGIILAFAPSLAPALATTWYINPNGAYTNAGTGVSKSQALKDFREAICTNAVSGDTVIVAPGTYREAFTTLTTWTSLVTVRGDPFNTSGFTDGSGILIPPGPIIWTARTTSDTAAGSASPCITFGGQDNVRWENIYWEASFQVPAYRCTSQTSTNHQFYKCHFDNGGAGGYGFESSVAAGVTPFYTFDKCTFVNCGNVSANCISIIYTSTVTGSDWPSGSWIRDCDFFSGSYPSVGYLKSGVLVFVMGGMGITNCHFFSSVNIITSGSSTNTLPWTLRGNVCYAGVSVFTSENTGQLDLDYNIYLYGSTLGSSAVTKGSNDHDSDWAPRQDFGSSRAWGISDAPFSSPLPSSPLIGAGLNMTTSDRYGLPRPNPNSIGAFEKYTPPGKGF